ncbi:MAG: riboflavin synthase [Desulfobulbaceae bacterium]|nr:riboflavin synthase [Desulfobulbaceae bacterium]
MFTGIVQGLGTVLERHPSGGGAVLTVVPDFSLDQPQEGESIAVDGVCLTARNLSPNRFCADVSPETLQRSSLGRLRAGSRVNLERALRLADRLGGHLVSGHVDCMGRVVKRQGLGDFTIFTFSMEAQLGRYVVEKGSVAISGVSLTVNSCAETSFSVSIIPHTLQETTLGLLAVGDAVNIEVDIIGKYVEKLLGGNSSPSTRQTLDSAFLARHGFM